MSHVEALRQASDQLAAAHKAGSAEGLFDAHLALFDALIERGMVGEATKQLESGREYLANLEDPARSLALDARAATLALMVGDYGRAEQLIDDAHGALPLQAFILRRDTSLPGKGDDSLKSRLENISTPAASLRVLELCSDAEAAVRDRTPDSSRVYGELLPMAGRLAVSPEFGCLGPVDRYLGLLSSSADRLDDAERHLGDALRIAERSGLHPWVARTHVDIASVLVARGRTADSRRAREHLADAREKAEKLGMAGLEFATHQAAGAPVATSTSPPTVGNVFRRDGEFWTITFAGSTFSLRHTKGLVYLAKLLAAPDREIHSLDLVRMTSADGQMPLVASDVGATDGLAADPFGGTGELLDAEAREDYRQRLADLDTEIAEAEEWNDPERAARLHTEKDFLVRELAGAVGLGGKSRTTGSASERARVSVTKAVWSSIDRINVHGPELGRHLSLSVHTGTYCSYTPDPALKIVWQL